MIQVSVPATSANLGVGFDCLGLALEERAVISFAPCEERLRITGCEKQFCTEENLVYQAFVKGCAWLKQKPSNVHIHIETRIPYARGLGSSAACIVAGLAGANAMCNGSMNKYELYQLAVQMEGHPDNIAPAIFGGLCASFRKGEEASMIRYGVKKDWRFVCILPDYAIDTKQARRLLPSSMSYEDAIHQMGRCMALAKGIEIGNALIVKKACDDRMHEPYRKTLINEYEDVRRSCEENGMDAVCISGSGPAMLALTQEDMLADALCAQLKKRYPAWMIWKKTATYDGVLVKEV